MYKPDLLIGPQTEYVFSRDAARICHFYPETLNSSFKSFKSRKSTSCTKKDLSEISGTK